MQTQRKRAIRSAAQGKGRRTSLVRRLSPEARQEAITDAAIRLFHERGFHNVLMDDIGATLGVTGPALYKYFRSKDDLLGEAMLALIGEALGDETKGHPRETGPNRVDALATHILRVIIRNRALSAVYLREQPNLAKKYREPLEAAHRTLRARWVDALVETFPKRSRPELRVVAEGLLWLCRSAALYEPEIDEERVVAVLRETILAVLRSGDPGEIRESVGPGRVPSKARTVKRRGRARARR